MKLCSGVSMDGARGLRSNVVCGYIATIASSAGVLRPRSGKRAYTCWSVHHPILIQRREVGALGRAQVAAGALHPQHLDVFAGDRVGLGELGRRVAAAGVGDPPVAAQKVGAVDETLDRIEGVRDGVVPHVFDVVEGRVSVWRSMVGVGWNSRGGRSTGGRRRGV